MPENPSHPGWIVQLAIHRAVRRDARRLADALSRDSLSWDSIRVYWREMADQLEDHHTFEDAVIWPLMAERLGDRVARLLGRNAAEHEVLAAAMRGFDEAVSAGTDHGAARSALQTLRTAIETHLDDEEADVLPLIPEAFTAGDVAYFVAESAKANPPQTFLPWLLDDATESDMAFFAGQLPDAVRAALVSDWLPGRRARVDALRPLATT
jgi:hypothetical protein